MSQTFTFCLIIVALALVGLFLWMSVATADAERQRHGLQRHLADLYSDMERQHASLEYGQRKLLETAEERDDANAAFTKACQRLEDEIKALGDIVYDLEQRRVNESYERMREEDRRRGDS